MALTFEGKRNGKYLFKEHEPNVLLVFKGPDADKFEQVDRPKTLSAKKVDFALTVSWCKGHGLIPRDTPFDRCVLSVVGPHADEQEDAIFKRKIEDVKVVGQTYWLCQSPGARPERAQTFCEDRDGEVPVFFLAPATPGGARPTTSASTMREWSADRESWTPLPAKLSPVTGKARGTAYALVLASLKLCNQETDLAKFADVVDGGPVKFRLGASTLLAMPGNGGGVPRVRRIVAVGMLAAPYSVWVR